MSDYGSRSERRRKRRQRTIRNRILLLLVLVIAAVGIVFAAKALFGGTEETQNFATKGSEEQNGEPGTGGEGTEAPSETTEASAASVLEQANLLAASYDYDGAIDLIKAVSGYETQSELTAAISDFEATKATLVEYDVTQICHVFYHSLIVDPSIAFNLSDQGKIDNYNKVMTTIDEYNAITQQMYDKGYVLVKIHDMGTMVDGKMQKGKILLPPDKTPVVLSIDDVSYYEYMTGHGFASKIILDENGYPTNEMNMADGSVQVGSYDVVPLLEDFIKEHPDFSYKGARGIIALTGYDGILGYRTAPKYGDPGNENYKKSYETLNVEEERANATAVAARMKELGWEFASHTWGHKDMQLATMENLKVDMQKWLDQVNPLLGGDTDILIFPFGSDIGSWMNYDDNEKFDYLKSVGFDYYCNVDGNQPWVQVGSDYLRQARINLDGYEMWHHKDKLTRFFDVDSVFDKSRPTPVPPM